MKITKQIGAILSCIGIMFVFSLTFQGCAGLFSGKKDSQSTDKGFPPPVYFEFDDVRVPEELKVDYNSSFFYRTGDVSTGVLVLTGRVELFSLISFFQNNMATDNWKLLCLFKSPRTLMLFKKETKWCVINITDEKLSPTLVEIWVAPASNAQGSGLLK